MNTEHYDLPSAQPLTEAYIHRTDANLDSLYGYHAGREQDWTARMQRLEELAGSRANAAEVAEVLRQYNSPYTTPEVDASIRAIAEGAPVIIGGQQAGLWSGALLVIHKAVSVVSGAKWATEKLGRKVVPVFWIAGEDHDWDEANHTYVLNAEQELRKLTLQRPEGPRTSVSRTAVDADSWNKLLEELEQTLPHSDFKPGLLEQLKLITEQSHSLSDMFAGILAFLFGKEGLVLLDADDPKIRRIESPMFRRMIEENDVLEQAYKSAAEKVKSCGYQLQADVVEASANLFVFNQANGHERTLLHKRDGQFQDRKGTAFWTKEQLLQLAEEQPSQLSNNVLTRPIMQDYLFPVLGTVLGPGEIAYWALTGEAFRKLGMEMPIIVPRMSFTLVEGTISKHMIKYELSFEDVAKRFEARKQQWLAEQDQLSIEEQFHEVKQSFITMYGPLLELAGSIQPGLLKLGETNRQKIVEQIEYLEAKTKDAFNKQYDASIRQLDRIALSLWPSGKPQERVINMTGYWNRYGSAWLEKLLELPFSPTGGHQLVYL
ncbi:bacillithiol biosynthesis cysteine-adding enzyme BshC [Paenibacillus glycanilyticus]|uniref:bacillithiol biosynthesis cysteine-adding enzyme BshC n=1 Tax=Paenibacillus glycanilyticus TaxID=126569 RepID=UPI002041E826|nr:bacillithiol biosynthesis cysteine-adding enzyme BshC [Paenibacillus glycanilyticus]MCM3626459.1 bacillithiol biosynthesis cysteine-adding enzyme BshC [Paenibacillus glycanilyticus]